MISILPVNVNNLLHFRGIESARVEFKASWDKKIVGFQLLKTICAFGNDLQNLNGGYIVLGVAEQEGQVVLPPKGLSAEALEESQQWIRGHCNRIDPEYHPVLSPEKVDGENILVIWVPGGDNRPHKAPDGDKGEKKYWVRLGSDSVDAAKNGVLTDLMQLTARIPFDARRNLTARIEDLREAKVREFLREVGSGLLNDRDAAHVYQRMRMTVPVNGYEVPKNSALLFFSDDPDKWFPGARIEVVQFAGGASGNILEEKVFRGALHTQVRDVLNYLNNFSTLHLEKTKDRAEMRGWVSYPSQALDEMVVNAVYHRSYEATGEPTKIYLYPDRIEVISYPGPVHGIESFHLTGKESIPPVPARNRHIGELLKELRLAEGRGTGVPKIFYAMLENGSPQPIFDFDENRSYFRVTLPAHSEYVAISALRDASHLRAIGDSKGALERIQYAWQERKDSALLASSLIKELSEKERIREAVHVYDQFLNRVPDKRAGVVAAMADAYMNAHRFPEAVEVLNNMPDLVSAREAFDAAILEKRAKRFKKAHRLFDKAGDLILTDVRALHEFAQTKIKLEGALRRSRSLYDRETRVHLLREAKELLERVVQMDAPDLRHAWAWYDLGRVRKWLKQSASEVDIAFKRAGELAPEDANLCRNLKREHVG